MARGVEQTQGARTFEAGMAAERARILDLIDARLSTLEPNDSDPSDAIHGRVMELRHMRRAIEAR